MATEKATLTLEDLTVSYTTPKGQVDAVRDVSLTINQGQTYGLVGESGSGKTTLALAIMRYLAEEGHVRKGRILFGEQDLLALSREELRKVWGNQISMVPQNPLSSLNPSIKIGEQIAEILRLHLKIKASVANQRAEELLRLVRLPDATRIANSYPHQLSGGQQQRVLIAMALSAEPQLLVLDEPTTGLDVTTEAAVLDLIKELIGEGEAAALYVTHNLGVVAGLTDRTAVLYASELVEDGPTDELFNRQLHPYTRGLIDSIPRLGQRKDTDQLVGIPGRIPSLDALPSGCVFAPRCAFAIEQCHEERPPLDSPSPGRFVRCHRWPEIFSGELEFEDSVPIESPDLHEDEDIVLHLNDVQVEYPIQRSPGDVLQGNPAQSVKAVAGFDLKLSRGQTLGLVGESGSGKTSLARAIIGLEERTDGEISLLGVTLKPGVKERTLEVLGQLQMVFQNPEAALNPYLTVGQSLQRPLIRLLGLTAVQAKVRVNELLEAVRLPLNFAERLPSQLSGGEKQRVAIARAFATNPDLLVADEPVSALDVSVQANVLNLLNSLQAEHGTTSIFISHDLAVVAYLADIVAVMYLGNMMELSDADSLLQPPYHPYTEALLAVIPVTDPSQTQSEIRLSGDIPSSIDVPTGCPFHTRCPRYLGDICKTEIPPWQHADNGKQIFCHIPATELIDLQLPVIQTSKRGKN